MTTAIEHHAGLDPARWLESEQGGTAVVLPVNRDGRVDMDALRVEISEHADQIAVISVMWANNEVGTIQPIAEIVALASAHGIPVHCDAVQAVGHVPLNFAATGLTTLALSAHKFGGPVGIGALLARRDARLTPLSHGGGQERKIRSGTLNAAGARAASVAAEEATSVVEAEAVRLGVLQKTLLAGIREIDPGAVLSGPEPGPERLPGNVHAVFPGCAAEGMMYVLDSYGVEASNGSACTAGVAQSSHVLMAMGRSTRDAASTMRFSLGHTSTVDDVGALLEHLPEAIDKARRASGRVSADAGVSGHSAS